MLSIAWMMFRLMKLEFHHAHHSNRVVALLHHVELALLCITSGRPRGCEMVSESLQHRCKCKQDAGSSYVVFCTANTKPCFR